MNIVPHFLWGWPSPVVEMIGGIILWLIAWVVIGRGRYWADLVARLCFTQALSAFYEKGIDPNHWSWADFLYRLAVVVLLEVIVQLRRWRSQ